MTRRLPRIAGLEPPEGVFSAAYFFSLVGPVALSAALGVQIFLVGLLAVKPPRRNESRLSDWGRLLTHPEWDILFYVGASCFTMAVGIAAVRLWNRRLTAADDRASGGFLVGQAVLQVLVAVSASALLLHQFLQARVVRPGAQLPDPDASHYLAFAAISVATVAAALMARTSGGRTGRAGPVGYPTAEAPTIAAAWRWSVWDLIVPPVTCALLYVTTWRQVAGGVFLGETLQHWDYFAMGPGLSFRHGFALGSEIHSAYGVGWPVVYASLSKWIPLSYGRMIQIASIHSCVYFFGIYLFLRLSVKRPLFAALGTGLAMLPYFVAMNGLVIWRIPNVTAMRWPFDIWCFIFMLLYFRTRRLAWALAGGAMVGLAVFFVIDTGMELVAAFSFFWLCTLILGGDRARAFKHLAGAGGVALGVLVAGLAVAGRGGIFNSQFLRGWLEAPLEFGAGFGMLPISTWSRPATLVLLCALIVVYLTQAGYTLNRVLHNDADPAGRWFEVIAGLVAVYGLLVLVKYMGHSDELIFYRLLVPAALLATILLDRASAHYGRSVRHAWGASQRSRLALRLPPLAAALVAVFVVLGPGSALQGDLLAYPNIVSDRLSGRSPDGLCLIPEPRDLCGMPNNLTAVTGDVRQIVGYLESLERRGETFAVIDEAGSFFNAATDTAPFGRYSRVFQTAHKNRLVEEAARQLDRTPPDYVVTRKPILPEAELGEWSSFGPGPVPREVGLYSDTWQTMLEVINRRYEPELEVGAYRILKLSDSP